MLSDEGLRIAIPSKGRLRDPAVELLERAGLRFRISGRRLFAVCSDTGTRIIFSNAGDIPVLVAEGVVDLGITGSDQVEEKQAEVETHRSLAFGRCRLSVAVHKDAPFQSAADLSGRVVGSKFVHLARAHFERAGARDVHVLEIQGALEIMVLLGLVDAIVEIVETGNSLLENDLREVERVCEAEAVLIGSRVTRRTAERDTLLRRIDGVLVAKRYSLLEFNCPADKLDEASAIAPGYSSPTIAQLQDPGWLSVKVLVERSHIHRVMDELEKLGCAALLETELRHTRL